MKQVILITTQWWFRQDLATYSSLTEDSSFQKEIGFRKAKNYTQNWEDYMFFKLRLFGALNPVVG